MSFLKKLFGKTKIPVTVNGDNVTPSTQQKKTIKIGNIYVCDGPPIEKTDKSVQDPPVGKYSEEDLMMNALANVLGMNNEGQIKLLTENSYLVGLWVEFFPTNTTRQTFLKFVLVDLGKSTDKNVPGGVKEAYAVVCEDNYSIYKNSAGPGCIVRF